MKISLIAILKTCFFIFIAVILVLASRGVIGNPRSTELNNPSWKQEGVFELSPERGRFSLLYSLVEDRSFSYSVDIAKFATPDVGYIDGKYVSLFAPGLSFIVMPGYLTGKWFNASQIGAYLVITFFAILNCLLIYKISHKITKRTSASLLASLIFIFATPAFAYSVNLYQHHVSTFILLGALYLLFFVHTWWSTFLIFLLCAVSIPVDYPNLFIMIPVGISVLTRLIKLEIIQHKIKGQISLPSIIAVLGVVPPLLFFMWFNTNSYGKPLQFSGTVPSVKAIDENGLPTVPDNQELKNVSEFVDTEKQDKDAVSFFSTRDTLNGFYTHTISRDRGVIFFTPVILFGIIGLYLLSKQDYSKSVVLTFIASITLMLYSMWGDPWGGWAFGSRYLIPVYAILAISTSVLIAKFGRRLLLLVLFTPIFIYSVYVNTAGALGTVASPPKEEVLFLESQTGKIQRFSYDRSLELIQSDNTTSIVYNYGLRNSLKLNDYFMIIVVSISLLGVGLLLLPGYIGGKLWKK